MIGKDIDYFQILKDRLNAYVEAMRQKPDALAPAGVIGPEFARVCGNVNNVYAVLTGQRCSSPPWVVLKPTSKRWSCNRIGIKKEQP